MQATLIYNPNAGSTSQLTPDKLLEALSEAGYDPIYTPTLQEADLDAALAEAKNLVVVCGGDGSIRAAAIRLLGRDVHIAPVPMGTANNLCRMLVGTKKPLEIISGLADPVERDIDIWQVTTPYGPDYFLEALGIGGGADAMEKYNPEEGKSIRRGIQTALQTLNGYQPKFFHINVDGQDFSGSYFLCEVMNTPTVGHHFVLAPEARPDDGLFDLVLVHASQRASILRFMTAVFTRSVGNLPEVSICRGHKLEIAWRGFPIHLDGTVTAGLDGIDVLSSFSYKDEPELLDVEKPYIHVELSPYTVHFLVPKETAVEKVDNAPG
ncbi:MAG: diacylglycerol/lipid kinase family protein [Syntrophothermus sp.]